MSTFQTTLSLQNGARAYLPPCILMIGFPVLEIDTSCNVLLKTRDALSGLCDFVAARKPLETSWAQHFCMIVCWTIKSSSTWEEERRWLSYCNAGRGELEKETPR